MNIKDLREKHNLTRKELCDWVGIPYATLQAWELGRREAPDYVYRLIEFYLDKKCEQ